MNVAEALVSVFAIGCITLVVLAWIVSKDKRGKDQK